MIAHQQQLHAELLIAIEAGQVTEANRLRWVLVGTIEGFLRSRTLPRAPSYAADPESALSTVRLHCFHQVHKWQPEVASLTRYATFLVQNAFNRQIAPTSRFFHATHHQALRRKELRHLLDTGLSVVEACKVLKMYPSTARDLLNPPRICSLDAPVFDDSSVTLADMVVDPDASGLDDQLHQQRQSERIREALQQLDASDRDLFQRRFGFGGYDPHTLAEIGVVHGVGRERIRQRMKRAMPRLREHLDALPPLTAPPPPMQATPPLSATPHTPTSPSPIQEDSMPDSTPPRTARQDILDLIGKRPGISPKQIAATLGLGGKHTKSAICRLRKDGLVAPVGPGIVGRCYLPGAAPPSQRFCPVHPAGHANASEVCAACRSVIRQAALRHQDTGYLPAPGTKIHQAFLAVNLSAMRGSTVRFSRQIQARLRLDAKKTEGVVQEGEVEQRTAAESSAKPPALALAPTPPTIDRPQPRSRPPEATPAVDFAGIRQRLRTLDRVLKLAEAAPSADQDILQRTAADLTARLAAELCGEDRTMGVAR